MNIFKTIWRFLFPEAPSPEPYGTNIGYIFAISVGPQNKDMSIQDFQECQFEIVPNLICMSDDYYRPGTRCLILTFLNDKSGGSSFMNAAGDISNNNVYAVRLQKITGEFEYTRAVIGPPQYFHSHEEPPLIVYPICVVQKTEIVGSLD